MMNNNLFDEHIYLVNKIVNKMNYGYVDKDDLYQAGLIGLFKATKKFNKEINDNFISFSTIYIISEIKNELRTNKLIVLNKKIIKIKKYLNNNIDSKLTISELSNNLNESKEMIHLGLIYQNDICSLNEINNEEEMINSIEDKNNKDIYIDEIMKLDSISKVIILLKYYKNYNQTEIAKIMNCSQSKISRIEKNALDIIKKRLK